MTISVLFDSNLSEGNFAYIEDACCIVPSHPVSKLFKPNIEPINKNKINKNIEVKNFLSDNKKVFISLVTQPYHFFHDALGNFLSIYEKEPQALYIFDLSALHKRDEKYLSFFKKTLEEKKINFVFIQLNQETIIYANNFYVQYAINDSTNAGNNLYNFFNSFIKNKNIKPFRKIYISRSFIKKGDFSKIVLPGASFTHDQRIDDEQLLENYLKDNGFEIIVPETYFDTFEDQINQFYEAKTVVSLTGSGLINIAWMQPRSTVVELATSMVLPLGFIDEKNNIRHVEETIHHFFSALSFNKEHNYIAIPNTKRSAKDVIKNIENNFFLKNIVKGN
jgi:hypothetical protein